MSKSWKSIKNREKQAEIIKAKLARQYFGEVVNFSVNAQALLDNAAALMILNHQTDKEILRGEKPDSQYTARINALNRTLHDLKKMREEGFGIDLSQD